MNVEAGMNANFGANSSFLNNSNGRQIGSYYNGSSNRLGSPIGYVGLNDDSGSILSSMARNVWGNGNVNYQNNPANMSSFVPSGSGNQVGITGDSINWEVLLLPMGWVAFQASGRVTLAVELEITLVCRLPAMEGAMQLVPLVNLSLHQPMHMK
jgi:hypothetical protein